MHLLGQHSLCWQSPFANYIDTGITSLARDVLFYDGCAIPVTIYCIVICIWHCMQPLCVHRQAGMYVIPEYAFCVCVCMRAFAHTLAMYVSYSYATVCVCLCAPPPQCRMYSHTQCLFIKSNANKLQNQHSTVNNRGLAAATTTDLYSSPWSQMWMRRLQGTTFNLTLNTHNSVVTSYAWTCLHLYMHIYAHIWMQGHCT